MALTDFLISFLLLEVIKTRLHAVFRPGPPGHPGSVQLWFLGASFYSHVGEKKKRVPYTEDQDRLGAHK